MTDQHDDNQEEKKIILPEGGGNIRIQNDPSIPVDGDVEGNEEENAVQEISSENILVTVGGNQKLERGDKKDAAMEEAGLQENANADIPKALLEREQFSSEGSNSDLLIRSGAGNDEPNVQHLEADGDKPMRTEVKLKTPEDDRARKLASVAALGLGAEVLNQSNQQRVLAYIAAQEERRRNRKSPVDQEVNPLPETLNIPQNSEEQDEEVQNEESPPRSAGYNVTVETEEQNTQQQSASISGFGSFHGKTGIILATAAAGGGLVALTTGAAVLTSSTDTQTSAHFAHHIALSLFSLLS